jgi:ABC-type nitrate/sulfonate/bicarbonate transport system ATPase subunit
MRVACRPQKEVPMTTNFPSRCAGKSTLLDILAARKSCGKMTGEVHMNGLPCGDLFRRISAYVAQEDVFVPTMTAWETLVFYATLTLPKAVSLEERTRRIVDVLQIMGLSRARHTQARFPLSSDSALLDVSDLVSPTPGRNPV